VPHHLIAAMAYSGPFMAHNPQMQRPTNGRSLMQANKTKSLNTPFHNQHVIYNKMEMPSMKKGDSNYFCRSHSTSFAQAGVSAGGKHYTRDPLTGTWFHNRDERRAELHDSRSDLAFRYTESQHEKGDAGKTYTIWAAPCPAGSFWREPMAKPQKPAPFGYTHGPTQTDRPQDPKDMADPLGPLTRTASAPNFMPQTQGRKTTSTMARSGSSTMAKSKGSSLGATQ